MTPQALSDVVCIIVSSQQNSTTPSMNRHAYEYNIAAVGMLPLEWLVRCNSCVVQCVIAADVYSCIQKLIVYVVLHSGRSRGGSRGAKDSPFHQELACKANTLTGLVTY